MVSRECVLACLSGVQDPAAAMNYQCSIPTKCTRHSYAPVSDILDCAQSSNLALVRKLADTVSA
jgi:hypothetical protein